MAKNQINFSKMTEIAHNQLITFKESALAIAQEDLRFKAEMKPLKAQLESILANRQNDIDNGMNVDDVIAKFPRTEVDNAIRKAETEHKAIVEPLTKSMKDTYAFIPEGMHDAYTKKITEHKRGDFLTAIKTFLENLGIEGCSQAQISKLAENMSDMFGARYAQSKKIVENGTMHTAISKAQFNKLFMAVFCDMYIK
ncbi:MAG: hypothetical protein MSH33_04770 [Fusobacterium necrophorum]|nr:hypothetical protein [Fusobacterium necrophorum]